MSLSLHEKVWSFGVIAFIVYLVGDIVGYWAIEALAVLLSSVMLLFTGWKVGKRV